MHAPRHNKLIYAFFAWFISFLIRKHFRQFRFNEEVLDPQKSVLLLSNHFSWWDGFLLFHLNRIYLKKRFHVMISEENHKQVWFFKYLGAFSIKRNAKSMLQSLSYAAKLLDDPQNLVLVFPQGKLYSSYTGSIAVEKGIWKLIRASNKNFQYLFVFMFVDYFQNRKPSVNCYLQRHEASEWDGLEEFRSAFNRYYQTSRRQQARIRV